MKKSTTGFFIFLLPLLLFAQEAPIQWGEIDQADLDMKAYELDPEAEAVILTNYATLKFNFTSSGLMYEKDHHVRIKIFKKSAFRRGDVRIPYYSRPGSGGIFDLKAQVVLPNNKRIEITKEDIFEEETTKFWSQKSLPYQTYKKAVL